MTNKRPISIDDLFSLQLVGDPQISPDGAQIVFVRRTTDVEKNKYVSQLWRVKTDEDGKAKRLTGGSANVGGAKWSPDGTQIAFTSEREDETSQIFLMPTDGGEAQKLTSLEPGGIRGLAWSPDGKKLAFLYRATPENRTKKAVKEREEKKKSNPPRVHKKLGYRLDGFGYWDNSFWQIAVTEIETGETQILTTGDFNNDAPIWTSNGENLLFLSDRREDWDIQNASHNDIYKIASSGGEMEKIPSPDGPKSNLCASSDGKTLAYLGSPDPEDSWGTRNSRVFVLPSDGGKDAKDLTGETDKAIGGLTLSDARDGGGETLIFGPNNKSLLFTVSENGTTKLCEIDVSGGELHDLTPDAQETGAWSVAENGKSP